MHNNWACPVCKNDVVVDNFEDDWTEHEFIYYCPNGCWQEEYFGGIYKERIGGKEWSWTIAESEEDRSRRIEDMRRIENFYRQIIGKTFLR